jgi:hypothetical protein
MADQEIVTLEERVRFLQRKNAEILHQLDFARETNDRITAAIATQAERRPPSPGAPRYGGQPPVGRVLRGRPRPQGSRASCGKRS